jgi:hypothetical protein
MDIPLGQKVASGRFGNFLNIPGASSGGIPYAVVSYTDPLTSEIVEEVVSTATGTAFQLESGSAAAINQTGTTVIYTVANATGGVTLKSVPVTGGTPTVLTTNVYEVLAMTPSGNEVLYATQASQNSANIVAQPIGGGTPVTVGSAPLGYVNFSGVYWQLTPDGNTLVSCPGTGLYMAPLSGSSGITTVTSFNEACQSLSITPNGQSAIYEAFNSSAGAYQLYEVALAANATPKTLLANDSYDVYGFTPNSAYAIVSSPELLSLTGGANIPLPGGNLTYGATLVTSGSDAIAWEISGAILRSSIPGGTVSTLASATNFGSLSSIVPVGDGASMLVQIMNGTGEYDLDAINVETSVVTNLSHSACYFQQFEVSPDKAHVAFVGCAPTQHGSELFIAPTDGSAAGTALDLLFEPQSSFAWADNAHLLVNRVGTPPPYGALDGVYVVPIVP